MQRSKSGAPASFRLAALALLLGAAQATTALTIQWDFAYDNTGFFAAGTNARTALEAAGAWYEAHITDTLSAIVSDPNPSSLNRYNVNLPNPSVVNSAGNALEKIFIDGLNVAANTIIVAVGAVDLSFLPAPNTNAIAIAQIGSSGFPLIPSYRNATISRGQGANMTADDINNRNDQSDQSANDFALWGGMMSFDIRDDWHDDIFSLPPNSKLDLFSVILHELGHVFGIGTADIWANLAQTGAFVGANAVAEHGGEVPLDGAKAHWSNGQTGSSAVVAGFEAYGVTAGTLQETAYDPIIGFGQRKALTELDIAALRDIGWQVTSVPLPGAIWLYASAGMLLIVRRRQGARA